MKFNLSLPRRLSLGALLAAFILTFFSGCVVAVRDHPHPAPPPPEVRADVIIH
jgi:hypothetical protein